MARSFLDEDAPDVVLNSVFKQFDVDGSEEFGKLCESIGLDDTAAKEGLQHLADKDSDGKVSLKEFKDWIKKSKLKELRSNNSRFELLCQVTQLFKTYDKDGDGTISWSEWVEKFKEFGMFFVLRILIVVRGFAIGMTEEDAKNMWHQTDINKDSKISFEEFWKTAGGG
ncbi:hypothetical protein RFI_06964 [Reticulomyxa filosa]|uniref:EF-hand domain-containing protein n=1 Tax=Reticulomyxa filosa TaxID=46433 RepID=X6NW98_RETFI|nr:hypothetical protein RFI_06964 [Reticulomyxa filosa]|eukprot:ETO30158.1 hypothetical protein RFI_06964 [Reticulomyxa filosa]